MFTAKVYRVMVGSLSGAMEEVYLAKETIRKWNQQNAERKGKLFMLVEWTTKKEDIQNVDVVIGIVDNWIENTGLIESCVEKGKRVLLLFNASQDTTNTIRSEFEGVLSFRERIQTKSVTVLFNGGSELGTLLNDQLDLL